MIPQGGDRVAMPAWVPDAWAQLSEDDQKSVSDFMKFLLSREKPAEGAESPVAPLEYGVFKGKIKVPEHFDDALPEFSDYM